MSRRLGGLLLLLAVGALAPGVSPETRPAAAKAPRQRAALKPRPEFKIELVAAEPLIQSPVAFDWGPDGRLWVVEMRDYPLGLDNKGKPGGRIVCLEDTHGNGHYDKATVFLDGLLFP